MSETTADRCGVCGSENVGGSDDSDSRGAWCNDCGAVYDIDEWLASAARPRAGEART